MSTLAKVFVVIILVLSVLFVSSTVTVLAVQTKWKAEHQKVQAELGKMQTELADLKQLKKEELDKKDQVISEKDATIATLDKNLKEAQAAVELANTKNQANEAQLSKIRTDLDELTEQVKQAFQRNKELQEQVKGARGERDKATTARAEAARERNDLRAEKATLLAKLSDTNVQLGLNKSELAKYKKVYPPLPSATVPTKKLDGKVVEISTDTAIAVISLGSGDGVKKGDRFSVRRGALYVGDVRVEMVELQQAAVRIVAGMLTPEQHLQVGDLVSTRFVME